MSKVIAASLSGGKVMAEGVEIQDAVVLCEGAADSEGFLILDEDKQYYVAKTSPDLKTSLEKIIAALNHVVTGLNAAGSALDGIAPGSGTPVTAAGTQLTSVVSEITTLKEGLK